MQTIYTFPNASAWPAQSAEEAAAELREREPEGTFVPEQATAQQIPNDDDFYEAFGEPHEFENTATGHPNHLETFGPDLERVLAYPPNQIWTVVDGEDGLLYLRAGNHPVNRIYYLITKKPWLTGNETFLWT